MAESKNNIVTQGLAGMIGDTLVFRQRAGKTIVSQAPRESSKPATQGQIQVRHRFQQAVIYGKTVNANPTAIAVYDAAATGGQSGYNIAVADFFNAPDITSVDVSTYKGKVGDVIKVQVTDDFAVKAVHVRIENPDNTLVETGDAKLDSTGQYYVYTATAANASLKGDKITVTATDTPDNLSTKQTVLP